MIIDGSFCRSDRAFSLKRFDSFVVYRALQTASGLSRVCSYEDVASALTVAGLATRRGARFTARVVRVCLAEIAGAGLIELEPAEGGFRVRLVADPYKGASLFSSDRSITETVTVSETESEPTDEQAASNASDAGFFGEFRSDSETVSETELVDRFINNNTQERKEIKKNARFWRGARRKEGKEEENASGRNVDQAVASVDVHDAEGRELRRRFGEIAWESTLNADLFDRLVAAVKLGFMRSCEVVNALRDAVAAAKKSGKEIWRHYALKIRSVFKLNGFEWTPTRMNPEPAPSFGARCVSKVKKVEVDEEDCVVVRDSVGRVFIRAAF